MPAWIGPPSGSPPAWLLSPRCSCFASGSRLLTGWQRPAGADGSEWMVGRQAEQDMGALEGLLRNDDHVPGTGRAGREPGADSYDQHNAREGT